VLLLRLCPRLDTKRQAGCILAQQHKKQLSRRDALRNARHGKA
jgi:hypothetical protein